ncbi:MAG: MFS transporter [Nanoarchaeota archaeon]|nr:MFS transporter [Nanoarchaeota archaeon]MBU4456816.1 MFS transporter [Nanoarchaeota archaeon]MCG2719643.1 MFS transporter [Nanoarchaeota archaeon]
MNRTIKLLLFSDVFVLTGFGLIDPILAIFIKENLIGGTIFAAGLASTLFLLTKCSIQLPFSRYVDKHDDKQKWLLLGTLFIAMVPFIYIFAQDIKMIYLAQILHGIGSGLAFPTWLGLWSTHLDKKKESFEWSLYSTLTGLGTAATAAIGAALAGFVGFKITFFIVGIMSLMGCFVLLYLNKTRLKSKQITLENYIKKRTDHHHR